VGKPQSCGKNWAEDMVLVLVEHVLRTNPGWFIAKTLWTDSIYILTYLNKEQSRFLCFIQGSYCPSNLAIDPS
jgi:hypothetical protein